jgi:two-component system cell cycle response regulator
MPAPSGVENGRDDEHALEPINAKPRIIALFNGHLTARDTVTRLDGKRDVGTPRGTTRAVCAHRDHSLIARSALRAKRRSAQCSRSLGDRLLGTLHGCMCAESANDTQRFTVVAPRSNGERLPVLTLLDGPQAGRVITLSSEPFILGRTSESTLVIDDEALSRQHARIVTKDGRHFIEDLESTNGTFVSGARVGRSPVPLVDGACIQLGPSTRLRFSLRDTAEIAEQRRIYESTVRDALTGLYNRRHLDERLDAEFAFAHRHTTALAAIFIDVDHFKRINDELGHAGGDAALRALGAFIRRSMRTEDLVARYGGEEFIVVLRGIPRADVLVVAERIRAGVAAMCFEYAGHERSITVSIGLATLGEGRSYPSVEALLDAADRALYRAKARGRDRVEAD